MEKLISVFKALSDRNRLRVFAALMTHKELCACQITELLQVTGATASRHLGVMLSADLIESRKDGRWVYYRLSVDNISFTPTQEWLQDEFEQTADIQADKKLLEEITSCDPEELCRRQRGEECCPKK